MVRPRSWIVWVVVAALGTALASAGLAQTLPKLPQDHPFQKGEGSPGQVTFSHPSHVDLKKPDCTLCHPALFKILAKGAMADGESLGHAAMERGKQCGACHDGKAAFGLDSCTLCHRDG